jgi:hypothetical protein
MMQLAVIAITLFIFTFLSGCKDEIIKLQGAHQIACEGLEKTIGMDVSINLEKKIIIKYKSHDNFDSIIIADKCMID